MFKTGDLVRRRKEDRDGWWTKSCLRNNIRPDATLVVTWADYGYISLQKLDGGEWDDLCFELVKINYKIEDFL